jgi:hypothetical protein
MWGSGSVKVPLNTLLQQFVVNLRLVPVVQTIAQFSVRTNEVGIVVGMDTHRFSSSSDPIAIM